MGLPTGYHLRSLSPAEEGAAVEVAAVLRAALRKLSKR